jgi:hypothetical protein
MTFKHEHTHRHIRNVTSLHHSRLMLAAAVHQWRAYCHTHDVVLEPRHAAAAQHAMPSASPAGVTARSKMQAACYAHRQRAAIRAAHAVVPPLCNLGVAYPGSDEETLWRAIYVPRHANLDGVL